MNGKAELENKKSPESDPRADVIDSKSSSCLDDAGVSDSPQKTRNDEEEEEKDEDEDEDEKQPAGDAEEQVPNEADSSEISIPSENFTGANGDSLPTTDSDCRASPDPKNWGKTTRPKSRKRKVKPLTPGYVKDWESNDSWTSEKAQEDCTVVAEEIETKRRKIKSLQQKNRRLKVRHSRLKAAIKEMKANMADRD